MAESELQPLGIRHNGNWLKNGNPPGNPANARRCGAKTRSGTPCRSPAVRGRSRCRMHGGAVGSGAPIGNQNAFKTGQYTTENIEREKQISQLLRDCRTMLRTSGA